MLGNQSLSILLAGKSALESSLSGKSMLEKKTDSKDIVDLIKLDIVIYLTERRFSVYKRLHRSIRTVKERSSST